MNFVTLAAILASHRQYLYWRLLLLLVLAVAAVGCSLPLPVGAPVTPKTGVEPVQNRLLVLGADGNLFTIAPDGSARAAVTADATPPGHVYAQPTWSASGDRIAWAEVNTGAGVMGGALHTAAPDGSDRTRAELVFPPFYLQWSPDGKTIAFLSNWVTEQRPTIALSLVELAAGGAESRAIAVGQPFYFAWSPDSTQLLTHVNSERTQLLSLAGKETVLAEQSASFAAPQWAATEQLLYVIEDRGAPRLVIANQAGIVEHEVTFFQAGVRTAFQLSPNGNYIAYTESDTPVGINSFGPLFLYNLATQEFEQLTTEPVIGFFWSPAGDQLLFVSAQLAEDRPWLKLYTWDGDTVHAFGRFIPNAVFFNQYLTFADQYAQNMRFWAPDGSAFVYAGQGEDGQSGIWLQALTAEEPVLVTDGLLATWSPR